MMREERGGRGEGNEVWRLVPIHASAFNRCPAVAPLSVLDDASKKRLQIDLKRIDDHQKKLTASKGWTGHILEALKILDTQQQASFIVDERTVDEQLYDGFFDASDKRIMSALRANPTAESTSFGEKFKDPRLQALIPLYKVRNYPKQASDAERTLWEKYRTDRLLSGDDQSRMARYFKRLGELSERTDLNANQKYILEELQLYGQSIMPD